MQKHITCEIIFLISLLSVVLSLLSIFLMGAARRPLIWKCKWVGFFVCNALTWTYFVFLSKLFHWKTSKTDLALQRSHFFYLFIPLFTFLLLIHFWSQLPPDCGELRMHSKKSVLSPGCWDFPRPARRFGGAGWPALWRQWPRGRELWLLGQEEEEKEGSRPGNDKNNERSGVQIGIKPFSPTKFSLMWIS